MDFGKVPAEELGAVDFSLPDDPAWNNRILRGKPFSRQEFRVGCAKWGRKEWVGKLYPLKTPESKFLDQYVKHYNSIELNATHYKIYSPQEISKWAVKADGFDFKFCPKFPQSITHYSSFRNTEAQTDAFLEGISAFGSHLGPLFLQVSERYAPSRRDALFQYLEQLPTDLDIFLEVRHPDWYSDQKTWSELLEKLRSLKRGLVITDAAGRRDCAHMHLTIPSAFVRFVGNSLHGTDYTRITEWAQRLKDWLDRGIRSVWFFMHMPDEAYSPELTVFLAEELERICQIKINKPHLLSLNFPK